MIFGRSLFKNIVIILNLNGQEITRYYGNAAIFGLNLNEGERIRYITSWYGQLRERLRRWARAWAHFWQPRSNKLLWDSTRGTRVGDIIDRPYAGESNLELHVYFDHVMLFRVNKGQRVRIPLFELKHCAGARVISSIPATEVLGRIRSIPYEL